MDTSMDTDCADADSDDSTDTVVASCEMRRRWRERRQDHGTEARKLGRRIKQERFDAAENLSATQTEDVPAPQPERFSRPDHAAADPSNWSETFAKRPIKVEPSFVPLYKVKLEHSRTMTDAADDVSWTPPAGGGGTCDTPPSARPDLNHPNSVMSGSDSDFDEPLSDDGSELEGFNDFLDGITRELNDGMYSDLRDGSFPKQEPSDQFSEPADHAKVKREPRCPSAQNLSADESHSGFDEPDGLDPSHEEQDKAADEAVDPPAASDVDADEVDESDEHRDDVDPAADNLEEPTADTDVTEELLQDSVVDEQDAVHLETDEPSTDDLAESMDSSTSDVEDPPQESDANRTMEEAALVETWERPDGSQTAEATDPCLPRETELSNKETQEFEPQKTVQTDNDDTTSDVPHEASYSQPTTCGTTTPSSDEKDESQTVEEKAVVFPTVDQGIQVDDLSDGEIQDSPDDLSRIPAREQMSEMVDRDVQTDPPETSVASLQTTSPPPSQSSKKASEAAADKNAKHIDEYCEKTFWLLETFSDGLSKDDDCDKTRSVLDGAKQVRNGLNKRHGLPLSEQLNLCTTAVRSMLNALRKLSTRPPRKKPPTDGKVETKDKPTEIVPPFTTSGDRPRELSAGSSRTAVREHDSLRCTFSVRCSGTEPDTGSTADGVDDDPDGPAGEASSSSGARLKSAPSGRVGTGDEASDISLWATTFFPTHKKRIIQDGYGRPFLDRLRDSAAVNSVYSTAFQRLAEKYQLVFKNSARLPDTVRKRMPSSDQWQEICSKRLKCELFTGFGIYLEEVADLQDEFLPLNPFRINLRPPKDGPAAGSEEGTPVADPKPSVTQGGVRHSSGGGGSRAAEPADEVGHGPSKRDGHNLTSSAIASEMGGNAFGGVASGDGSAAAKVRQGSGGAQVSSGTAGKPVHVSDRVKHPSGEVAERTRNLSGGAPERTRQLSGRAPERTRQLSGGAAERSRQLSGGAPERTRQLSGGTPSERSRQPSGDTSVAVDQSSGGGPSDPATRSSGGISFKIRRSSGSIRHSSGGSGSTSGRITPNSRTGNVWEMECENFLDKIRPPGESPSKAPELQDAPLPVTPEKAEEQNLPPSTPQNPATSNPSRSKERKVPLRNQSFRCLIPIFRTNLNSSSASSSSKVSASAANVSASAANVSAPAANVSASGVRVSASEGNLSASDAGGSASGANVSASDANVPASDANARPSGASTPLQDELDNVSLLSEGEIPDWSPSPQKGGMPAAERPSVSPACSGSCDVRDTDARHSARRILRDGLNLLDRQTMAPATASVKRPRQASGEGDSEARKRSRVRSVVKRRESSDELVCEEHGVVHEHPWTTFLHIATRISEASYVSCPLCDYIYRKTSILEHAKSVHRISKPGGTERDRSSRSSTPDSSPAPSRRNTSGRRRSLSDDDSPRRSRASKRSRLHSPDDRSHRRVGHHSPRERHARSTDRSPEEGWHRRVSRRSSSPERDRSPERPARHRAMSEESVCWPAPRRQRHRSASVESTRFPERSSRYGERVSPRGWLFDGPPSPRRGTATYTTRSRHSHEWSKRRHHESSPTERRAEGSLEDDGYASRHWKRNDFRRRKSREDGHDCSSPDVRRGGEDLRRPRSRDESHRSSSPDRDLRTRRGGEDSRHGGDDLRRPCRDESHRRSSPDRDLRARRGGENLRRPRSRDESHRSSSPIRDLRARLGGGNLRRRRSRDDNHRGSSPTRNPRVRRGAGDGSRNRSRSPVGRPSGAERRRQRDIACGEMKHLSEKLDSLQVDEQVKKHGPQTSNVTSDERTSGGRKMFHNLFVSTAAKLRSHLADIESDSAKSDGKSEENSTPSSKPQRQTPLQKDSLPGQSSKDTSTEGSITNPAKESPPTEGEVQDSCSVKTQSSKVPPADVEQPPVTAATSLQKTSTPKIRLPKGFSKDELRMILATINAANDTKKSQTSTDTANHESEPPAPKATSSFDDTSRSSVSNDKPHPDEEQLACSKKGTSAQGSTANPARASTFTEDEVQGSRSVTTQSAKAPPSDVEQLHVTSKTPDQNNPVPRHQDNNTSSKVAESSKAESTPNIHTGQAVEVEMAISECPEPLHKKGSTVPSAPKVTVSVAGNSSSQEVKTTKAHEQSSKAGAQTESHGSNSVTVPTCKENASKPRESCPNPSGKANAAKPGEPCPNPTGKGTTTKPGESFPNPTSEVTTTKPAESCPNPSGKVIATKPGDSCPNPIGKGAVTKPGESCPNPIGKATAMKPRGPNLNPNGTATGKKHGESNPNPTVKATATRPGESCHNPAAKTDATKPGEACPNPTGKATATKPEESCPNPVDQGTTTKPGASCPSPTDEVFATEPGESCPNPIAKGTATKPGESCPNPTGKGTTMKTGGLNPNPTGKGTATKPGRSCPNPSGKTTATKPGESCPKPTGKVTASKPEESCPNPTDEVTATKPVESNSNPSGTATGKKLGESCPNPTVKTNVTKPGESCSNPIGKATATKPGETCPNPTGKGTTTKPGESCPSPAGEANASKPGESCPNSIGKGAVTKPEVSCPNPTGKGSTTKPGESCPNPSGKATATKPGESCPNRIGKATAMKPGGSNPNPIGTATGKKLGESCPNSNVKANVTKTGEPCPNPTGKGSDRNPRPSGSSSDPIVLDSDSKPSGTACKPTAKNGNTNSKPGGYKPSPQKTKLPPLKCSMCRARFPNAEIMREHQRQSCRGRFGKGPVINRPWCASCQMPIKVGCVGRHMSRCRVQCSACGQIGMHACRFANDMPPSTRPPRAQTHPQAAHPRPQGAQPRPQGAPPRPRAPSAGASWCPRCGQWGHVCGQGPWQRGF